MRKRIVIALSLLAPLTHAQFTESWSNLFDFGSPSPDHGLQCVLTSTGNVMVLGDTASPYPGHALVIVYSPTGQVLGSWTPPRWDYLFIGVMTANANGGAYVAWMDTSGTTQLTCLDGTASVLWSQPLGLSMPRSVVTDSAGNAISLTLEFDGLAAYSPTGALLWSGQAVEYPADLGLAPTGDIVVVGSGLNAHARVARLTSTGSTIWSHEWNFNALGGENLNRVAVDSGGFSAAVGTMDIAGADFPYLVLIDPAGAPVWLDSIYINNPQARPTDVAFASDGSIWYTAIDTTYSFLAHYSRGGTLLSLESFPNPESVGRIFAGRSGQVFVTGTSTLASALRVSVRQYDSSGALDWTWLSSDASAKTLRSIAGNGVDTLVVAGDSSAGGGNVYSAKLDVSAAPEGYCTAKVNSLGCTPNLVFTGSPSTSANSGFTLRVSDLINQTSGLCFYGVNGAQSVPFGGGFKCVANPTARAPLSSTGGSSPSLHDCSGVFAMDFNAFAHGLLGGQPLPALLVAGTQVHAQVWSRDSGSPSTTNLSSALRWTVLP